MRDKPTMGSLFAGIGGFDLGFERAGFETVWQVEINEWARKILAKNFSRAERYADIRECGTHNLNRVDVIVGGFPCQDISNAGLRAGIGGARSGLWGEMHRIIRELQPRFVLVENVAALLGRGMGRVLGDLAEIGYDAEWEIVSAADVGAPHLRERVWILAYPQRSERWPGESGRYERDGDYAGWSQAPSDVRASGPDGDAGDVANTSRGRCGEARELRRDQSARPGASGDSWWAVEPSVGRVAHGIPARVDRLRGLGNAVVPQIPELYAQHIKELLHATTEPE